jgi:hypothetical protein
VSKHRRTTTASLPHHLQNWIQVQGSPMVSPHALARAQQRCIPPFVLRWLDDYGEEQYDGHGGVKHYFSHRSIARMSRVLGKDVIQRHSKLLKAYAVLDARTGDTVTCGWRYKRIRRR